MKVGFRQGQKFAECAGMSDDPQNFSRWAMTAKASLAPVTSPAREIDLADNTTAQEAWIVGCHNFSDEFVSRRARESVIAAKKLEIGVADASAQKTNHRIAFGPARLWNLSYRCATLFKVNRNHSG